MKKFLLLPLLMFAGLLQCPDSNASDAEPLIVQSSGRKSFTLDGKWNIIIDPMETGYFDYRLKPANPSSTFAANRKPRNISDRVEYDFDRSPQLDVPGDWNTQMDVLKYYEGTVWYKRTFRYTPTPGKRQFVWFGAVNYEANVYLNGKKLGDHTGGFTPFNFEITGLLVSGDNHLVVRVNNTRRREGVPTVNFDWWNYGGITRPVKIIEVAETFIRSYTLQPDREKPELIKGTAVLDGPNLQQTVTLSIPEAGVRLTETPDEQGVVHFSFRAKVENWSDRNPKLYEVIWASGKEQIRDRIGFRTIATRGHDILLNGEPVFLRGICIHEEAPYRAGRAFSEDDARTLLGWAKDLGCNFVRLAHYPHNENMVRVADEMGMMVWEEIPVYWTILWENSGTYANACNQLTEVITRDRNRASVILWSMANETPRSPERLKFISGLARLARQLDPTRLITAALEIHITPDRPSVVVLDDPLAEYLDVYGCNEYFGWYTGTPEKADTMTWEIRYDKPLIISEFGAGALQGFRGDEKQRWTEEFQDEVYRHNITMLDRIPFLRGTTPWILKDFRSPKRVLPGIQDGYNRKGLVSDRGVRKKAFYTLKAWYRKKAVESDSPEKND